MFITFDFLRSYYFFHICRMQIKCFHMSPSLVFMGIIDILFLDFCGSFADCTPLWVTRWFPFIFKFTLYHLVPIFWNSSLIVYLLKQLPIIRAQRVYWVSNSNEHFYTFQSLGHLIIIQLSNKTVLAGIRLIRDYVGAR